MSFARVSQGQQWIGAIRPMATACLVASVTSWIGVFLLYQRHAFLQLNALSIIASLLMVCAFLIPSWADQLEASAEQQLQHTIGHQRMAEMISAVLGDEWTLFQNVTIGSTLSTIDGVLVGPHGIFALELKNGTAPHRNQENRWQLRNEGQTWRTASDNPSLRIQQKATQLSHFLTKELLTISVYPRIVWVSDEWLLTENPVVPIWNWQQSEVISTDIEQYTLISAELLRRIQELFPVPINYS